MGLVVFICVCVGGRYSVWTAELGTATVQDTKAEMLHGRSQQDNQTGIYILGFSPTVNKGFAAAGPEMYQKTGFH